MRKVGKFKRRMFFARIGLYQPKPYIGYCKDGSLSWWFYHRVSGTEGCFERNILGRCWTSFFNKIGRL